MLLRAPGTGYPLATACAAEFDWKYITVNGTKTCPELAATHAIVLVRSVPGSTGRDGLTWLIVELEYASLDVASGTIEFKDMRILLKRVLGARDDGWTVAKTILPYSERSYAGRIRRGVVLVEGGAKAGNLNRVVGDVVAEARVRAQAKALAAGAVDRRSR